jgi:uncharacterized protein YdaT
MYWTQQEYPADMHRLPERIRLRAIEIANQLQAQGYHEMKAIPVAIAQARHWWRDVRSTTPEFRTLRK